MRCVAAPAVAGRGARALHCRLPVARSRRAVLARVAEPLSGDSVQRAPAQAAPELARDQSETAERVDLKALGGTIVAVTGVVVFWRGVWSLLDHVVADSVPGDVCCIVAGLSVVLYVRLSGVKAASSLWPPA